MVASFSDTSKYEFEHCCVKYNSLSNVFANPSLLHVGGNETGQVTLKPIPS